MSKPNINELGPCGQLTVYEQALREAQRTIDGLRAKVKELEDKIAHTQYSGETPHFHSLGSTIFGSTHAASPAQRVPVVPMEHEI